MIEYKKRTLANGLTVVVNRDKASKLAAVNILYKVGARNENPARTGFAHLFEHLMFRGTREIPNFDLPVQMACGDNNAFTNNDYTDFYITLPKDNIETALWLESDRMEGLDITPEKLEAEKRVVIEEFRQRYLNQPYGDQPMLLRALAYKVHPYRWATIGLTPDHIAGATLDDVQAFYRTHYHPSNAILSVSADFDEERILDLAEKWFAPLADRTVTPQPIPREPQQEAPRRETVERDVPATTLSLAFHMGGRTSQDFYTADLVSDLLSGGDSSRLYKHLVQEQRLLASVNAYISGDVDPGLFVFTERDEQGDEPRVLRDAGRPAVSQRRGRGLPCRHDRRHPRLQPLHLPPRKLFHPYLQSEKMTQPPLVIPSDVEVAQAGKSLLANGSALYTLASDDFEVLRITFVFRAGSAMQRVPFSASAAANMLAEGTRDMTAHQIAERLDYYGSYYDVNIDRDYAYISFCMLSKFFDETLAVAEQILLHPVFPEEELRTYCAKRKQRLAVERTKVDTQAREAFARALFGPSHPYGISADEAQYDKLTRGDVAAFYESHYTADNGFTICSGRIGDHERQAVAALAERLPRREPQAGIPFPAPVTQHEARVDHPGAVQSSIRIGRLLFPRQHPDFLGMQVVASALGGYFGSRLMQNLREEHGYTYGVVAAMVNFEREGYFAVAAQVGTEVTQEALREIYTEIERLRAEPMPEGELSLVKNIMVGEMMRILDGPFGIADVTIENILCGRDHTVINENIRRIQAMTPADVQQLARKYLSREELVTVIAGDLRK